jgi:hypothetical protein
MQYLCLFWATENPMYSNYCVYKETVLSNGQLSVAQRPPCKSFCVQVLRKAESKIRCIVAYSYFLSLRWLKCVPTIRFSSFKLVKKSLVRPLKMNALQVGNHVLFCILFDVVNCCLKFLFIYVDPQLKGKVLASNLGCAVPFYSSPYFRVAASFRTAAMPSLSFLMTFLFLGMVYYLF